MSEITEKFCEECGKNSPINVKFCKFCGVEFPKIDHPEYIQTNFPQEQSPQHPIAPPYYPIPQQNIGGPHYQQPQQPDLPPQYAIPPVGPQMGPGALMNKPPRAWDGGGLFSAIKGIYTKPYDTTLAIIEDPQAPSSFAIVFLAALFSSLASFITTSKMDVKIFEDDNNGTLDPYRTNDGIRDYAVNQAIIAFIVIFVGWFLFSWLLGKAIKGGIPVGQYLLIAPSKSMRQFTGFLYVPLIIKNIVKIVLLQFENDRDVKMTVVDTFGGSGPSIEYLSDYSYQYTLIMTIIVVITVLFTIIAFYRSTRNGMNHNGVTPILGIFVITIIHYLIFLILGP